MSRLLTAMLIILTLFVFTSSQSFANGHQSPNFENKVISVTEGHNIRGVKRSVVIRLSEAIDVQSLRLLAERVRKDDPKYQRTFMVYLLPGMTEGNGAWAVTNYGPDLEIEIWGHEVGDTTKSNLVGVNTIGHWFVPYVKFHIWIHERADGPVLERAYLDGSSDLFELTEIEVAQGRKFEGSMFNDGAELFLISPNGQLEIIDKLSSDVFLNPYQIN
jgi:hypothetical protein